MKPMLTYERLSDLATVSRRTVADALEVLRDRVGFGDHDHAILDIGPMRLPSGKTVGLVQILFYTEKHRWIAGFWIAGHCEA